MDALIKMCGEPVYKVIVEDSQGNQIAVPTFYLPATTRQIGGIKDGGHIKKLIQEEVEKCNNYELLKAIYAFVRRLNK